MNQKIIFNGKSYNSVTEMPREVREAYERINKCFEDRDADGVPDVLQNQGLQGLGQAFGMIGEIAKLSQSGQLDNQHQFSIIQVSEQAITINGKTYRSVDEMPDHILQIYENAIRQSEPGKEEIYEESWRQRPRQSYFVPHDDENFQSASASTNPTMETVTSNSTLLILAIAVAVVICIGLMAWLVLGGFSPFS